MIALVPALPEHVAPIAAAMRAIDRRECAAFGRSGEVSLRLSLLASESCTTAFVDGVPQAMFGLVALSALGRHGRPWFLGTDAVYGHGRAMLSEGRRIVASMRERFEVLSNFVSCENERAIGLLRRWGFIVSPEIMSFGGVDFHHFGSGN